MFVTISIFPKRAVRTDNNKQKMALLTTSVPT